MMQNTDSMKMHTYWLPQDMFRQAQINLTQLGYSFTNIFTAPYQALRTHGRKLVYAPPEMLSGMWVRQVSGKHHAKTNEGYLIASANLLPKEFEVYLDDKLNTNSGTKKKTDDDTGRMRKVRKHAVQGEGVKVTTNPPRIEGPVWQLFDHSAYQKAE
jgi:hypothetical protein